jgi:hypothetical protein
MKLEDIKKKNIYSVPDNYFEQLPMRIQSRVNENRPVLGLRLNWNLALKIALPAIAVVFLVFYFGISTDNTALSADDILAQVSTEDLIAYVETTDITTDEIIEELDFSEIDFDDYEQSPLMQDMEINQDNINALMDEYGIEDELL